MQGLNLAAVNAEVDRRGFVPVNERMQVLDKSGKALQSVWCIGDANGAPSPFPSAVQQIFKASQSAKRMLSPLSGSLLIWHRPSKELKAWMRLHCKIKRDSIEFARQECH